MHVLNDNDHREFLSSGLLTLRAQIDRGHLQAAREHLVTEFKRLGFLKGGRWQRKLLDSGPLFQNILRIAERIRPSPWIDRLLSADLLLLARRLSGSSFRIQNPRPQLLVTPPMSKDWVLPQAGWHRDARVSVDCSIPGIQIFILIDELMPRGGGTLLRPGSHRPEWAATAPEEHNVLELFGSAGDVFFMNPAVLHAPSINANRRARLMLTARFLKP